MRIETKSLSEIKSLQERKLKEQLHYLQSNSPYYKRLFEKRKIEIDNIKTIEDLVQTPTITKDDFSNHNFDFLCVSKNKIIDYSTTSGTTGSPVTVALTENDLQRLAYNEEQSFICANGKHTDVYQLMLTLDRQFMAGMAYYLGIRKLGAGSVRVGPISPQMQWENIHRFKPNSIVAVPSFILKLIDYAEANGIDVNKSGIERRSIVLSGIILSIILNILYICVSSCNVNSGIFFITVLNLSMEKEATPETRATKSC